MLAIIIIVSILFWTGLADPGKITFSDLNYTTNPSLNPFFLTSNSVAKHLYADAIFDEKNQLFCIYHTPLPETEDPRNSSIYTITSSNLLDWSGSSDPHLNLTEWGLPEETNIVSVAAIPSKDTYYLFFSATTDFPDYQHVGKEGTSSAIFVAKADNPYGPFKNARSDSQPLLRFPYTNNILNATDNPSVVLDQDNHAHLLYTSGPSVYHLNMNDDLVDIGPGNGNPPNFSGGVKVFIRGKTYYMLWKDSANDTALPIRYAMSPHPEGLFVDSGWVLEPDQAVATKLGHATVINVPTTDIWYLVYSRTFSDGKSDLQSGLAYDRMYFNDEMEENESHNIGPTIKPVQMGVAGNFNAFSDPISRFQTNGGRSHSWWIEPMALLPSNFSNFVFDIDVAIAEFNPNYPGPFPGDVGVMFRVAIGSTLGLPTDNYYGYYAGIRVDGRVVLGMANGTWNELMVTEPVLDTPYQKLYRMRVWTMEHRLKVHVDDMENALIDVTDETHQSGGAGLRSFRVDGLWDNMEIRKL
ncbi:Glycosyl hydrolase, five-bladed beta-propellor domain containing protein [Rhypophila decipiens]